VEARRELKPPRLRESLGTYNHRNMRRLFILLLLLALPISATAASFEARSPRHLITLEPVSLEAGDATYDLTISDLATGKVLGTPRVSVTRGILGYKEIDVAGFHITIQIGTDETSLTANIAFEQGEDIVDDIRANWMLKPRRIRLHTTSALRVSGDVKAPIVVKKVEPVYSEEARKARISGIVIVEIVVDHTGHVTDAVVLKPLPFGLSESALDAVKQWVFEPGTLNGSAVDVIFNLTVNFKLTTPPPVEN